MNERLEILQHIIPSGLLAESISSLALTLGYKSRATLYRIMEGTASTHAVNEFYRKVEAALFLSEDTLYNINSTIGNAIALKRLLKSETHDFKDIKPWKVIEAFIRHDYSIFSDSFRSSELPDLLRLEHNVPVVFFTMLAYFYFRSLKVNFYESRKSHKERCAQILEPLGEELMRLFPANGIAAEYVYVYSRSEVLNAEAPILWNLITSLATLLQCYGTPDIGKVITADMHLMTFLGERTYWRTSESYDILLLRAIRHNVAGSGYYQIFKIAPDSHSIDCIGAITFLSDEIVCYKDKRSGISCLGVFERDNDKLQFMWEDENKGPFAGGHWERQPTEYSQSLRKMDRTITDYRLTELALLADGYKLMANCAVTDVNLSRTGVNLTLANGSVYAISYAAAPFLEYILPTNDVIVAKQMGNGEIFVFWPQLMHCIPLRLFTRVEPEKQT